MSWVSFYSKLQLGVTKFNKMGVFISLSVFIAFFGQHVTHLSWFGHLVAKRNSKSGLEYLKKIQINKKTCYCGYWVLVFFFLREGVTFLLNSNKCAVILQRHKTARGEISSSCRLLPCKYWVHVTKNERHDRIAAGIIIYHPCRVSLRFLQVLLRSAPFWQQLVISKDSWRYSSSVLLQAAHADRLLSYHDGGDHHGAVLHARRVVGEERRVLDQHQFVGVVPVADLEGRRSRRLHRRRLIIVNSCLDLAGEITDCLFQGRHQREGRHLFEERV